MFDPALVRRAVDLQQRSYKLLRWATDAVDRGFIAFKTLHRYASLPEATFGWLDSHYSDLPRDAQPPRDDLRGFSNLFASYLYSSFDLVEDPGQRRYSPDAHCFCPMCSWLVAMPRLQAKKLTRHDKARARKLEAAAVRQIARDLERTVSDEQVESLVDDRSLREALALVAYGHDLLRRIDGISEGPATLALWRGFAWTYEGSPKHGFELTAQAILDAEATLSRAVISLK